VGTDGTLAAIERTRTALEVAMPYSPITASGDISTNVARTLTELQHMANIVLLASLVIAGCSLAVSVTAGVSDRRLPFSLLRLAGAPISVLRRVVALEAAVPLLLIAVISAGAGLAAADLFLRSQLGESLQAPGIDYYVIVLAGIVASLAVIASTLPLIERITGPEVGRNE
jgi:predicted lysophospholipase L1 biosynthesis ABC-type transport system permease subunit